MDGSRPTSLDDLKRTRGEVKNTAAHLRRVMENKEMPTSLARTIEQFLRHWATKRQEGALTVFPGNKRIAEWGKVKRRQAIKNIKTMEQLGIIKRVRYESGGRNRATEFQVSVASIRHLLVRDSNPSKQLLEKLQKLEKFDIAYAVSSCSEPPKRVHS